MKTTLLGLAMPKVLKSLKEILTHKGFIVQTMPTPNPVLIAYRKGNWYRSSRQLILEIMPVENELTRIDITAIMEVKKSESQEENIFERSIASILYNTFKNVIRPSHGI